MKNFSIINNMKKNYIFGIIALLILAVAILLALFVSQKSTHAVSMQNQYNLAFFELIDYLENVEIYLAKAMVSSSAESGAENLTQVWREANLAQVYLAQLPISSNELSSTAKFLNQVSEYSYSLSRKNIYNEDLTQEDLNNLKDLHTFCKDLNAVLLQLSSELDSGQISWKELTKNDDIEFAQQVDNLSSISFSNLEQNFGEYQGLIYDGAYSEHIESAERKGLTGNEINEETAKEIAITFIGNERISEIKNNGLITNGNIPVFDFSVSIKNEEQNNPMSISISQTGGHIVNMNYNRNVASENISQEDANKLGKNFLDSRGIHNMQPTYYFKQGNVVTINYAYVQNNVTIYPDLIKLKIALDNGEILGIETVGYLNNHYNRNLAEHVISLEEAKSKLNTNLEISSSGLAIIPTEWRSEIYCYEFRGKLNETEYLIYINVENGREEDILVLIETDNGILTQ